MASINDKYRQFRYALVQSPEYMGLANKDRQACMEYVDLATKLDKKSPPDPEKLEAAYVAAIDEARKLVTEGLLTVELPDEKKEDTSKSDAEANTAPTSHHKYEIHPTAAIFPLMSDEALDELAADIKEHGLRDPVVMHDGTVIDGRNRLEACHRAGVEPTFTEWTGSGSVVTWILSVNLHRRHLTNQQRAMIAGKVAHELAAEAKSRSAQNLRKSGDPVEGLNPGPSGESKSAARAAKLLNVSRDATNKAARIAKSGSDELVQAVTDGTISLDAAARVAELPKAKQRSLLEKGQVQAAAKKIRKEKAASKETPKKAPATEPTPNSDDDGPRSEPLQPNANTEPAADAKSQEAVPDEVHEEAAHEDTSHGDPDDAPLLRAAHRAIDEMVQAGRFAGKMDKVAALLGKLIEFSTDHKTKFESLAMP
jgi:ParB-like chromosome segregation protein Spo0J